MSRRTLSRALRPALLVLAFVAGGCASPGEPAAPVGDIRFDGEQPIVLDVARVAVEPGQPGEAEGADAAARDAIDVAPSTAMRRWAEDRLEAAGSSGEARFDVVSARVETERLPRAKGAVGLFGSAPGTRYTMTVEGRLTIVAADGRSAMASAKVVRKKSMQGNRTREERRYFRATLTETTIAEFDRQMAAAIRRHLNAWVL